MSSCVNCSCSPLAIRSCSRTISMPVIISVTGMLDLQPRVHFDEIELAVFVQKLKRPGAAITDFLAGLDATLADAIALLVGDPGSRRFLDDFLVAPLHRTVALAQVNGIAVRVSKHLELDVSRRFEEFLHVDDIVAECGARLGSASR